MRLNFVAPLYAQVSSAWSQLWGTWWCYCPYGSMTAVGWWGAILFPCFQAYTENWKHVRYIQRSTVDTGESTSSNSKRTFLSWKMIGTRSEAVCQFQLPTETASGLRGKISCCSRLSVLPEVSRWQTLMCTINKQSKLHFSNNDAIILQDLHLEWRIGIISMCGAIFISQC